MYCQDFFYWFRITEFYIFTFFYIALSSRKLLHNLYSKTSRKIWSQFSISRNEETNVVVEYILLMSFRNIFCDSHNENPVSSCCNKGFVGAMVKNDILLLFCQRNLVQYREFGGNFSYDFSKQSLQG